MLHIFPTLPLHCQHNKDTTLTHVFYKKLAVRCSLFVYRIYHYSPLDYVAERNLGATSVVPRRFFRTVLLNQYKRQNIESKFSEQSFWNGF